ncbi:hypothetical protein O3P69_020814 [Scylla paramamosain]|uniref:Uncharacterized protein n=1 Tax=Scylla paramamosain TaxID=85552 RepID=A0AAW0TR15_SCYPA
MARRIWMSYFTPLLEHRTRVQIGTKVGRRGACGCEEGHQRVGEGGKRKEKGPHAPTHPQHLTLHRTRHLHAPPRSPRKPRLPQAQKEATATLDDGNINFDSTKSRLEAAYRGGFFVALCTSLYGAELPRSVGVPPLCHLLPHFSADFYAYFLPCKASN